MSKRLSASDAPRVDLENQCLWVGNQRASLTPKAFGVLRFLAERPGQLATKRELLDAVWPETAVGEAVLSVAINQLRAALGDDPAKPRFIETLHRRGYRWMAAAGTLAPPQEAPAAVEQAIGDPGANQLSGRATQLEALQSALQLALSAQPQIVFVTGEAGIGKTALVDQFIKRLGVANQVLVARGQCLETFGSGEAYLPLLQAFESLVPQLGAAALANQLRRWAPTWLSQLPALVREQDRVHSAATRERMLRECCDALEAIVAETPLVLVIEDLHWSDASTLAAIEFLAQRRIKARLLLIATYRPVDVILSGHSAGSLKQKLHNQRLGSEIPLWYLSPDAVSEYLRRRCGGEVDDQLVALVQERTEGHPLFLVSVVDRLQAGARLEPGATGWRLRSADDTGDPLPEGLVQAIEHNLSQLEASALASVAAASVIGLEFAAAGIAACLEADPAAIEEQLEELAARSGLLRTAGVQSLAAGGVTGRFALVHALYRNVLYDQLSSAQRAHYHRRFAQWLEANGGTAAELAHHYGEAISTGTAAAAIRCRLAAAAHARQLCAWDEAIGHFELALKLLAEHPDAAPQLRPAAALGLGETLQRAGMIDRAQQSLWRAVEFARASGDAEVIGGAALALGHSYQRLGRIDTAITDLIDESLRQLGPDASALRARLLAHLAFLISAAPGTVARREALGREALATARQVDDPGMLVWVLNYLRWSSCGPQDRAAISAEVAETRVLLPRVRDPEDRLMLLALIATDALEAGEPEHVDEALDQWTKELHDAPIPWCEWFLHRIETARALHEGRLADAERLALTTFEVGQRMDNPNVLPCYGAQMTCLRLLQGRIDEAADIVQTAVDSGTPGATWHCVLAYLRCQQGRLADARQIIEVVAAEDFSAIPRDSVWLIGAAALAMACNALADRRRAALLYDELLASRERCPGLGSSIFGMGHMSRYLALLAQASGWQTEAIEWFETALRENARLQAWPWLVFTQRDYAALLRGRDDARAAELLAAAATHARRMGMAPLD